MVERMVTVKCGHLSGTSRSYKVPASTTVEELLEKTGFSDKFDSSRGDKVMELTKAGTMENVEIDTKVKAGVEYVICSDLKAR